MNRPLVQRHETKFNGIVGIVCPLLAGAFIGLCIGTVVGAYLPALLLAVTGSDVLPTVVHKAILFWLCWVLGPLLFCCCFVGSACCRRRRDQPSCGTPRCALLLALGSAGAFAFASVALAIPGRPHSDFIMVKNLVFGSSWPAPGYCNAAAEAHAARRNMSGVWWHQWGTDPASAADALARAMTPDERASLLNGEGYGYFGQLDGAFVGGMPAIPRLRIPSMHLQDAAQGFRTSKNSIIGQVTSWPCLLALTSTWDPARATELAEALGDEFKAKGANVILGPSVNVHRSTCTPRHTRSRPHTCKRRPPHSERLARSEL